MEALELQALQQRQPQPQQPRAPVFRNRTFTQQRPPPAPPGVPHRSSGSNAEMVEGIEESDSEGAQLAAHAAGGKQAAGGTVPQLGRRAAVPAAHGGGREAAGHVISHRSGAGGAGKGAGAGAGTADAAAALGHGASTLSHVSESDFGDSSSSEGNLGRRAPAPPRAAAPVRGERSLNWAPLRIDFGAVDLEALRPSNLLQRWVDGWVGWAGWSAFLTDEQHF